MKKKTFTHHLFCLLFFLNALIANAQITNYPWPSNSGLISDQKYQLRAREYYPSTNTYGTWKDLTEFYSKQRAYADHWKVGGDAGTDYLTDRSLTFVSFSFGGKIEVEVTQKLSTDNAVSVEITPKPYDIKPHFFDGKVVRFIMDKPEYISVFFNFGSADQTINKDANNNANNRGYDIKHGLMIFTEVPEAQCGYTIPKTTDPGVVVWSNNTPLSTIRNASIIYFPAGEHELRTHPERWEKNSSTLLADAAGNWVTTPAEYDAAALYRGKLNLGKDNQKVYLAPGAIVYGGFHSNGKKNNWIYGPGIVTGRKHLMHELVRPEDNTTIAVDKPYVLLTETKRAFCYLNDGAVYDGTLFLEAWHHTCPSGNGSTYKRMKIIGWCSNNDGIRPGSNSYADRIFIKTSDDYDYSRDRHTVKNAVMWPMANGGLGQLGWNNLGDGYAKYDNIHVINSEWDKIDMSKGNIGVINGGMADATIKLEKDTFQNFNIENRTNYLVAVKLSGTGTGYLRNFLVKNITTEYPLSNTAGTIVKQELSGISDSWVEGWTFTNVFINGVLLTWQNYKNYFNLNLTGSNGTNTDNTAKAKNITFNTLGTIYKITYTKSAGGTVQPSGSSTNVIQIAKGMNQTVSFIPNSGYRIKTITVDGAKIYEYNNTLYINRKQSYTFKNISANHTVDVTFEAGTDFYNLSPLLPTSTAAKISADVSNSVSDKITENITVYPNPCVDDFNVDLTSSKGKIKLDVYNLDASLIHTFTTQPAVYNIQTSSWAKGTYLLKITCTEKVIIKKLIVK